MNRLFTLLLIVFSPLFTLGQNPAVIDSLEALMESSEEDTNRLNILTNLFSEYVNSNPDKALERAEQSLALSEKLSNDDGIAISLSNIGIVHLNKGNYVKAINHLSKAKALYQELNDKHGVSMCLHRIGLIHKTRGKYQQALDSFLKSLKLHEELDDKYGVARSLISVGSIYRIQGNYDKALGNYLKSLEMREALLVQAESSNNPDAIRESKQDIAASLNAVGTIYDELGETEKAMGYYQEVFKTAEELGHKRGMALSLNNIAGIYYGQGDFEKTLDYSLQSLEIEKELGDQQGIAISYNNIGSLYVMSGDYGKAIEFSEMSLEIAREIDARDDIKEACFTLAETYASLNNYQKAFEYYKIYSETKDGIFNEASSRQMAEMQTKYDTEKKEKEIEIQGLEISNQEAEVHKQKIFRNSFIGGFVLVLIIAFVLFNRYQLKQRANSLLEEQNSAISRQKEEIEQKSNMITESINYALHIQQAILVREDEVKKYLTDFFVFFKPKDIVSGDFYWFAERDNMTLIAAVDCTGHGVPGAFMSMIGTTLLNEIVNEKQITTPAEVLKNLHTGVNTMLHQGSEDSGSRDGMDLAFCTINHVTLELQYAGAHNSLYLIRNGELQETKADKMHIGDSRFGSDYKNHIIQCNKGDSFYLFSDGYADQRGGPKRKKFYYPPFKDLLAEHSQKPMEEQKRRLDEVMSKWRGDEEQIDDILVIGVRV